MSAKESGRKSGRMCASGPEFEQLTVAITKEARETGQGQGVDAAKVLICPGKCSFADFVFRQSRKGTFAGPGLAIGTGMNPPCMRRSETTRLEQALNAAWQSSYLRYSRRGDGVAANPLTSLHATILVHTKTPASKGHAWMDVWMDGWRDGRMEGWTDGRTGEGTDRGREGGREGRMDGCVAVWPCVDMWVSHAYACMCVCMYEDDCFL